MAIQTRYAGDLQAVKNVGVTTTNANAIPVFTGIAGPITAYKLGSFGITANLAAEQITGGAVETMLRVISGNATILGYQCDVAGASAQLSVLVERTSWTDATLTTAIVALAGCVAAGANIGAAANIWIMPTATTVTSTGGIKLA